MNKLMHNLIMYHEIHRLKREGFKAAQIGKHLVLDRRTVKKYLIMSEDEFLEFKHIQDVRSKILDIYEDFVKTRLEDFPEASAAQIHDWLKEHHSNFIDVSEKTVFNFTLYIRNKHRIPKPFNYRDFAQVEELFYGKQAQVDFGEYNMTTEDDNRKKVYFFSMVLSRSRQKYLVFRDKHFDTIAVIDAHEKSFFYFQGFPELMVYDQDKLMLVDENKGDLILTEQFRQYIKYRGFKLHFCRKADPQSKGKIENVIKYIKYNFLRGRKFIDSNTLNGQAIAWLERTANAKVHAATKKIPYQEWLIEKQHLKAFNGLFLPQKTLTPYTVRKDNTIAYKGNFYRLPLKTYTGHGTVVYVKTGKPDLVIYDANNNKLASYKPFEGKGKLIGNNNFKRDYSSKIDTLMQEVADRFKNTEQAIVYLQKVKQDNPRYIRDQLLLIKKMTNTYDIEIINKALDFCIQNKIFRATDLESVAKKIHTENDNSGDIPDTITIKTLNSADFKIIPQKSDITDYNKLMS